MLSGENVRGKSSDTVFQDLTNTGVSGGFFKYEITLLAHCSHIFFVFPLFLHFPFTACSSGFFKAAQGDHTCLQCPINSRTTNEGATNCVCRNGYYRTDSDPPQMPCTSTYAHATRARMNSHVPAERGGLNFSTLSLSLL